LAQRLDVADHHYDVTVRARLSLMDGEIVLILSESDLHTLVPLDGSVLDVIQEAFRALATGQAEMPPILHMEIAERQAEVDVKTAYVRGLDSFAVKISPGFFMNPGLGLPSLSGMMIVLSASTGVVQAILLDNGYLTHLRTAAAGAVAARFLAPIGATRAGIIGAGVQGCMQALGLALVRPIRQIRIWDLDPERARETAQQLATDLGVQVSTAESAEVVVRESQVVVTCTPARSPVLHASWLHPGLHITAMGSDAPYKQELEAKAITDADLYVCDRRSQCELLGELHHAVLAGLLPPGSDVPELGEILAGFRTGRTDESQITICDLTGTGVQDTAIAAHALRRAEAARLSRA
jgi:ectoine utilization protein EutC